MVVAQYSEEVLQALPKHLRLVLEFAAEKGIEVDYGTQETDRSQN